MSNSLIRISGVFDNSGYGVANKATVMCFIEAGFEVSVQILNTYMSRREFSDDCYWQTIIKHTNLNKPKINVAQLMPPLWKHIFQKDTFNIGLFFWESDKICDEWIDIINNGLCNEIWVSCKSNYDALINSGIKKQVYIIPQYTNIDIINNTLAKSLLSIPNDNSYRFYSIFQWSERKNGKALVEAYCKEFSKKDNTLLILKVYGPSAFADRRWIKELICEIKEKSNSDADIYLIDRLLTSEQISAIAPQCQCYVTTTRGEGWNIPLLEALSYNKQIIITKTGGISDWITNESAYIIPHKQIPINTDTNVWGTYYKSNPPQHWGDVMIEDVQAMMRKAYNEKNDFSMCPSKYKDILNICDKDNIMKLIKKRLADIL